MDTPYSVVVTDEVPSTQELGRERYEPGRPAVVIAHRQTRGRGRGGAEWLTAPRAIAVSVGFECGWDSNRRSLIPLVAGVAAARVLGDRVRLKWPNDVLVDGRKVAGILVESVPPVIVAGMGLNLFWPQPPEGAGALTDHDPGPDRGPELALAWADELLALVGAGAESWPRREYETACVTLGAEIEWEPEGRGRAVGLGDDGSLVVETPGGAVEPLTAATVRHVRSAT